MVVIFFTLLGAQFLPRGVDQAQRRGHVMALVCHLACHHNGPLHDHELEAQQLGRFAVVAAEVRGLAKRVAEAADQMTATLKDVQHHSHQTTDLVIQVAQAAIELHVQSLKLAEQSSRFKPG